MAPLTRLVLAAEGETRDGEAHKSLVMSDNQKCVVEEVKDVVARSAQLQLVKKRAKKEKNENLMAQWNSYRSLRNV